MVIKKIDNKEIWLDGLNTMGGEVSFLYSWSWGEFQAKFGTKVIRLGIFDEEVCRSVIYGVEQKVPFLGSFVYFPRCPITALSNLVFSYLADRGYFFVRLEPDAPFVFGADLIVGRAVNRQPQQTLVFSLDGGDDQLLAKMHEKTRYNIRLAARKGVVVREKKDAGLFIRLNEMTTKRDRFKSHEKKYYENMLAVSETKMFVAEFQGEPLAAIIGVVSGSTFTYLHGASSDQKRNLMAPYLVQWEAMKAMRDLGVRKYDFWGVSPQVDVSVSGAVCFHGFCYDENHKWAGVTRFKAGFGGEYIEYPDAKEVVLNEKKFRVFSFLKKFL